jgi:hypothetical protein
MFVTDWDRMQQAWDKVSADLKPLKNVATTGHGDIVLPWIFVG